MTLLQKIGNIFSALFNAAKRAYQKLTPAEQDALVNGSGIMDLIDKNLDKTPKQIRDLLLKTFPTIDVTVLESTLFRIADLFNIGTKKDTLEDLIAAFKKKLQSLEGQDWAIFQHALASALAVVLSPKETKVSKIVSLMEWVFQFLVKK